MGQQPEQFIERCFPANFIAEGLDQTRGWFYSLIVLGTALFGRSPYQNVIVNGLVLAEDGKKMSKSLRNYPDPMELADRVGVDAIRLYLMTSPVIRGEDLNFSEKEVLELQRKNIGRLHNVLAMYEMYADGSVASAVSSNVLDRWIVSRLNQLIAESTAGYKAYELDKATRPLADFIDDVSVWYLRRSRERLKGDDSADKQQAISTLRYILRELAKVMAPAMPFYAEYLYRAVRTADEVESVHLTKWPEGGEVDEGRLNMMNKARLTVTIALEARTRLGVKVRQPLQSLTINGDRSVLTEEYIELIKDEVNVKDIYFDKSIPQDVSLDTTLTPELLAEGAVREVMRAVQDMRKQADLTPADLITLLVATDAAGQAVLETPELKSLLLKTVNATAIMYQEVTGMTVMAGEYQFVVAMG
jgi:isoleucyl-tRNA synthetase